MGTLVAYKWLVKENIVKLYLSIKKMNFKEDDIEHEIISGIRNKEFYGYDMKIEFPDNDKFIKDTLKIIYKKNKDGKDTKEIERKIFIIREQKTWWSFPLYEIINGKIIDFDYARYSYFSGTDRRMVLASKINELYNPSSEAKILRKTIKFILDELKLDYPDFLLYNKKIEEVINKNPKDII